jgi:hypothetical protein
MLILDLLMEFIWEQMLVGWNPLLWSTLSNVGEKFTKASLAPIV